MRPEPYKILEIFYETESQLYKILIKHSELVARKAIEIANNLDIDYFPNLDLIHEASLLHDIGIFKTDAPDILCNGVAPYLQHGIIGREILESYGLFKHALICERHIGAGITVEDIRKRQLPLPERDMMPQTVEEKIVCLADNFYSKNPKTLEKQRSIEQVRNRLRKHGDFQIDRINDLMTSIQYRDNE